MEPTITLFGDVLNKLKYLAPKQRSRCEERVGICFLQGPLKPLKPFEEYEVAKSNKKLIYDSTVRKYFSIFIFHI